MRVHRNLNKACWSITRRGERVIHTDATALQSVRFVVSAAGRNRVLSRKVRAVHAWADGVPCDVPANLEGFAEVNYNPYRCGSFTRRDTGAPVDAAALVVFAVDGKCYAKLS